jgi:hypothetical protein
MEALFKRTTDPSCVMRACPSTCAMEPANHTISIDLTDAIFTRLSITMAKVIPGIAD